MDVDFFGPDSNFFETALGLQPTEDHIVLINTSTTLQIQHSGTGAVTTLTGSGISLNASGDPTGGDITGVTFASGGSTVAIFSNFSWSFVALVDAVDSWNESDDFSGLNALFSLQSITLNAEASSGFDMSFFADLEINNDSSTITGSSSADILYGGSGEDDLYGGLGRDLLYGGNETGDPKAGDDLFGGGGNDKLFGGGGSDGLYGGNGADRLEGGSGKDWLKGGSGQDRLFGGSGNDKLFGGAGKDLLNGGKGKDKLDGEGGNDRMTGGGGNDTFIFSGGNDVVTDFNAASSRERVDLRDIASITGFDDLMDEHVTRVNGNVIIDDLSGNTLTLNSTTLNSLGEDDFIF